MKIILTGAESALARHLVPLLLKSGHQIHCWLPEGSDPAWLLGLPVAISRGALLDQAALFEAMRPADALIHLSGLFSSWEADQLVFDQVNINGSFNVFSTACRAGVPKVVFVSTALTYGKPRECPFNEGSPPSEERFSRWADSLYYAEQFARKYASERGMPLVVLQPGLVLSAEDALTESSITFNLIYRSFAALAFVNSLITFVSAHDVANAVLAALEKPGLIGKTFLIGKETMKLADFYALVSQLHHVRLPRLCLPDWLALFIADLFTIRANRRGKAPWRGFSSDLARTLKAGLVFTGSKAEQELGIRYTPVAQAVAEVVETGKTPTKESPRNTSV